MKHKDSVKRVVLTSSVAAVRSTKTPGEQRRCIEVAQH